MALKVREQLDHNVPFDQVTLPSNKANLVAAQCEWINAAVIYSHTPDCVRVTRSGWKDLDVAWQVSARSALEKEGLELERTGRLWVMRNPKELNMISHLDLCHFMDESDEKHALEQLDFEEIEHIDELLDGDLSEEEGNDVAGLNQLSTGLSSLLISHFPVSEDETKRV